MLDHRLILTALYNVEYMHIIQCQESVFSKAIIDPLKMLTGPIQLLMLFTTLTMYVGRMSLYTHII